MEMNMKTIFQVRVRRDGKVTIPKELRDRAGIQVGSRLILHDVDKGVVIISLTHSRSSELADQLAKEWRESGITLEVMLATLRQVRKKKHTSIQ
jgi:AbrB family looped-hinge helix DNA binding protein